MTRSMTVATPDEPDPWKDPREFKLLRVGDLVIDPSAQRPVAPPWKITEIAGGWDFNLAEAPTVTPRGDGTYAVDEGQTRVLAFKERFGPDARIMCAVTVPMPAPERAGMALRINDTRRKMTPAERWIESVRAGQERYIAAEVVLGEFGVRLSSAQASATSIRAIALVESIVKRGRTADDGAENLRRVLYVLDAAYPVHDDLNAGQRFHDELLRAVWDIVRRNANVDLDKLAGTVRGRVAEQWCTLATPGHQPAYRTIVDRMARLYNKNMRRPERRIS